MFGGGKTIWLVTKGGAQQFAEEHLKARPRVGIVVIGVYEERTTLENESAGSKGIGKMYRGIKY